MVLSSLLFRAQCAVMALRDECAVVSFMSPTVSVLSPDCEWRRAGSLICHSLSWRRHLSITAVNVGARLFKMSLSLFVSLPDLSSRERSIWNFFLIPGLIGLHAKS